MQLADFIVQVDMNIVLADQYKLSSISPGRFGTIKKIGYIVQADAISSWPISLKPITIILIIARNRCWPMSIVQAIILADPAFIPNDVIESISLYCFPKIPD
ncbi:hypothetical protein MA16_Dca028997 [Dendrobium catenatum]|uniref:Uncharacterized protein n=1 Tax=Dendrobium catenatum TaxID=906689 RepID=A0A2I0VE17_9ASPA|nr:hypothetical protein MA16_Dca028997 [Dendrobium catenatum]